VSGLLPDPYREQVRAALRADTTAIVLGILFLALALAVVVIYRLRRRSKDPALLWLGCFAGLYAVRMMLNARTVQFVIGLSPRVCEFADAFITYVILLPSLLFVWELFPDRRAALRWVLGLQALFAAGGILLDQLLHRPHSLGVINNVLVIGLLVAIVTVLLRQRQPTAKTRALPRGSTAFRFHRRHRQSRRTRPSAC